MAQIIEQRITIVVSQMIKDKDADAINHVNDETLDTLRSVTQELVGGAAIVEVTEDR